MTNGHVSFNGERRYGQHGGVCRRFRGEPSDDAKRFSEHVRIPAKTVKYNIYYFMKQSLFIS